MSIASRKLITSTGNWDTRIWIVYEPENETVSFCENCAMADDEVLTNSGLTIKAEDWRVMLATLDREGNAIYGNVVMFMLTENTVGIAWVTQKDDLHFEHLYAPGRLLRLITARNLMNLD